ncbi:WG repeat-containing protein [uncultured Aquimarina sp.]|uniref:WG repeat-containing protein n=1 Tax=uncultured Aquimarina sp. TaxID=575652 RepID=UPI00261CDB21|nr:WG repeat-containing protein [uncultured Aquimarina sp.]
MVLFKIQEKSKCGFINENGDMVVSPKFEKVFDFNEGLSWAAIMKDDKWAAGFINETGEWAIEPNFSGYGWSMLDSSYFSEGLAPIQSKTGKMLFINKQGDSVTDAIYESAHPFSEGRALVSRNGLYGYIDHSGNEVIECKYGIKTAFSRNSRFSEGLAMVRFNVGDDGLKSEDNYGYINKDGDIVFDPQFFYANAFSEGFTMIKDRYDYYFMNIEGEIPFEQTTQVATSFSEGLADMYDTETESMGFINTSGEWIIKPQFSKTSRFTEGLACVKRIGIRTEGFINTSGEMVISPKFKTALPFKNGLAYVEEKDKKGYINMSGEYVWESK